MERLKSAIEKARVQRSAGATAGGDRGGPSGPAGGWADWSGCAEIALDPGRLARNRIVSFHKTDPAYLSFDVLRTRLLKVCADNGWTRIGLTSPTKGCGKTVVGANLAMSLARHPIARTVALDLDLRSPSLARTLGVDETPPIGDLIAGRTTPSAFLRRFGDNLLFGLNGRREPDSAELLQSATTASVLAEIVAVYEPTILLCDLPPLLVSDDTIGALACLDAILLVTGAGQTKAADIRECEHLLGGTSLIGVVLNKCEPDEVDSYAYDYA